MSTTREMVEAFTAKQPPATLKTVSVRQFELTDPDDLESSVRELTPKDVPASYCWRLDVDGITYWISQADDAKLLAALKPVTYDEGRGSVVGTRVKVRLDGTTRVYGPVELSDLQWQRIQALNLGVQKWRRTLAE